VAESMLVFEGFFANASQLGAGCKGSVGVPVILLIAYE
jgi:hypothetical protein